MLKTHSKLIFDEKMKILLEKKNLILLYLCYVVQSIHAIIICQSLDYFSNLWNVNNSKIFLIISFNGLGKLLVIFFSGSISDKIGRKITSIIAMMLYIFFFSGLLFIKNFILLCLILFCGGAGSSFLDGAAYPLINENFGKKSSFYMVLIKICISISVIVFPIYTNFIQKNCLDYRWTIILPLLLTSFIFINLFFQKSCDNITAFDRSVYKYKGFRYKSIIFVIFSFSCMCVFNFWYQILFKYSQVIFNLNEFDSRMLISYYGIASIISCVLTALLTKIIEDRIIILFYFIILFIVSVIAYLNMNFFWLNVLNIAIGLFASGGILQIGNALFNRIHPKKAGVNTSIYNSAFSVAVFIVPFLMSFLVENSLLFTVPIFILIFNSICLLCSILIIKYT